MVIIGSDALDVHLICLVDTRMFNPFNLVSSLLLCMNIFRDPCYILGEYSTLSCIDDAHCQSHALAYEIR